MAAPGEHGGPLPPDTSRGPLMLKAIWSMDGIAAVVLALRLITSGFIVRKISLADYLMVSALLFGIANNACITVSEHHGLGRHIMYLEPVQIVTALKWQTVAEPLGIMSPTMGRLSFTIYMLKLVGTHRSVKKYILHFCIWFNLAVNILCIILIFVQCGIHVTAIWDTHAPGADSCWSKTVQSDYGYFQGACNSFIDLTLTLLPVWVVWNLKLPRNIRIGLMVLLGLSLFAAVASIVKTVKLEAIGAGGDITYNLIPFVIWFTVENNVVITTASVPSIKPLFSRGKKKTGYGSYNLSGYGNSSGRAGASRPGVKSNPSGSGHFNHSIRNMSSAKDPTVTQIELGEDNERRSYGDSSQTELARAA